MANYEFVLPIKGFSEGFPVHRAVPSTSGYMNNVRIICVLDKKYRICQRPALVKWGAGTQIGGAEQPVVAMCTVSSVN
jgi:hypothetical protein